MNFNRLILGAAMLCWSAASAEATRNPTPPPSGIVVHLFGPDSVMGNIAPDLPGETPKPTAPESAQPVVPQPGGSQASNAAPVAAPQAADISSPSVGAILHQLFVVGDPEDPNKPAPGRTADRPQVGN